MPPNDTTKTIKLVSWNVAGRKGKQAAQAEQLLKLEPTIVALQEVTAGTLGLWSDALCAKGLKVAHSGELVADRKYFNLVACAGSLRSLGPTCSEFPERTLSVSIQTDAWTLELHNAHIVPGSSRGIKKLAMLEQIYTRLSAAADPRRILCGDFNLPQSESTSGEVVTWADHHSKAEFERWNRAELDILTGLAKHDLHDCYRKLYGYATQDFSWYPKSGKARPGRRFDHVFAAADLGAQSVKYVDALRTSGLSDHAAVEAVFQVP